MNRSDWLDVAGKIALGVGGTSLTCPLIKRAALLKVAVGRAAGVLVAKRGASQSAEAGRRRNLAFDFRMLRNDCEKFGREVDLESFAYCDTLRLSRRLVPGLPCYSLSTMIDTLKLDGKNL